MSDTSAVPTVSRSDEQERLVRRFAELDEGSFVWTRDTNGWSWLGSISGPSSYDAGETVAAVDLVHVRPCVWLSMPMLEQDVPVADVRHIPSRRTELQQIHHPSIDNETQRIWDARQISAQRTRSGPHEPVHALSSGRMRMQPGSADDDQQGPASRPHAQPEVSPSLERVGEHQ